MSQTRSASILLLVITAVLWSSGGILIKLVQWNAPAIAAARSAVAACVLLLLYRKLSLPRSRAAIGAALAYSANVLLFVVATKLTTAANAILLQYTAPVYVALFGAWYLGERATRLDWITIALVLAGMALFFLGDLSAEHLTGNLWAALSGVSFGWFTLFMRRQAQTQGSGNPLESIFWGNVLTALVGAPFAFGSFGEVSATSWLGLLALGVFQLGVPYILYVRALPRVSALEAILIPTIEPLLNPLWVLLAVGEIPGISTFAGGAVVVGAVTLRSLALARQQVVKRAKARRSDRP